MTDKEIIIDGVDVAGCRHCMYKGFKAFPQCKLELDSFATACVQHKECEYKQLKRLEQENAELKAENDKLRNELATYGATGICETCTGKANKQADKYYKTLQEIKEIAEFHITQADSEDVQNDMKQIIDLITKAESEG